MISNIINYYFPSAEQCAIHKKVLAIAPSRVQEHYSSDYLYNKEEDRKLYEDYKDNLKEREITILPYRAGQHEFEIECPPELLAKINLSESELKQLFQQCFSLALNPVQLLRYLKPIDALLGKKLAAKGIEFKEEDEPQCLITGRGFFLPGPPPEGYQTKKKGRTIDALLLELERFQGLNQEGTPIFVGGIKSEVADEFIKQGHIFKEDVQISTLLLHGKNSHRLFFQALVESLKDSKLKPKDLLELLVSTKIIDHKGKNSMWIRLMDSTEDIIDPKENMKNSWRASALGNMLATLRLISPMPTDSDLYLDDSLYNYSCRDPFTLNSLILCFGKELGLPNLMHYLLDSHWKSSAELVNRLPEHEKNAPMDALSYIIAMEAIALDPLGISDIGNRFDFTLKEEEASIDEKYRLYPDVPTLGIKYKLGENEPIDPVKLKADQLQQMKDPLFLREFVKDAKHHDLIIEFLKKEGDHFYHVISQCCILLRDQENPNRQSYQILLEKVIHLKEIELIDTNTKRAILFTLQYHEFSALANEMGAIIEKSYIYKT